MHKLHAKRARHVGRGHIAFSARISVPYSESSYHWSCVCKPSDGHDHAAIHALIAERLLKRDRHLPGLHGLVGFTERRGVIRFTVTDCNIQIIGPAHWRLYVAWDIEVTGEPKERHHFTVTMEDPEACMSPDDVLSRVRTEVDAHGEEISQAMKAVADFTDDLAN